MNDDIIFFVAISAASFDLISSAFSALSMVNSSAYNLSSS
jgi:hypothetical protein